MSIYSGPEVSSNGLVFHYDMANTNKSWKGKPTTNLVNDTITMAGWNGTYTLIDSSTKTFNLKTIQDSASIGAAWRSFYWSVSSYIGQTITISADVEFVNESNSTFRDITIGQGNTGQFPAHIAGSDPIDKVTVSTRPFQKIKMSWTGTINSTAIVGFTLWITNVTVDGGNATVKVSNVQIEVGSFATPFVNGTRSNTQSLLDITKSNIITNTEMTYNSDGSFKFDGVNDYATISTFVNKPTTSITMEAWIKPTKASVGTAAQRGGALSCTNTTYLGIIDSSDGGSTFSMHWANQTSSSRIANWNGNIPNNSWSYLVGTYDGTTSRAYLNGVEIWSAAQTGTIPDGTYVIGTYGPSLQDGVHNFNGNLDIGRIYNRALSAAEVKQNYNAFRGRFGV